MYGLWVIFYNARQEPTPQEHLWGARQENLVGFRLSIPLHLRDAALLPAFYALSLFLLFFLIVCPIYRPTATKMCMQVKHLKPLGHPPGEIQKQCILNHQLKYKNTTQSGLKTWT